MKIGTTSFGFRYWLLDPARAPALTSVVEAAGRLGLDALQICENARPMELGESRWDDVVRCAVQAGVEIQLGCKTTSPEVLAGYLERAVALPARLLRVVIEEEDGHPPTRADVDRFLFDAWPLIEAAGARLAIENHFDLPSRLLAEAAEPYPPRHVGFCVDTANSLRNFETPEQVLDLLGDRAFCYHLKDFRVEGDNLGFRVGGAPLGEGHLDLDGILARILARDPAPEIFIENWAPATGDWETDVRQDEAWLRRGLHALRTRLEGGAGGSAGRIAG